MNGQQEDSATDHDQQLWNRLIALSNEHMAAELSFLQESQSPLERIRAGLNGSVLEIFASLSLLSRMEPADRMKLLPELLWKCQSVKFGRSARHVVLSLPTEWLIANIEAANSTNLVHADNVGIGLLLGLYEQIAPDLALRLAEFAVASEDYDIREVGEDYIKRNATHDR
jgi:hypothetical protein